ncbi:hypothetical protein L484_017786 [Morus notabilis]|uniref:Uncharacterized protein n=1 Tax=Morus notabilis TaxID=981085 RepID=W9R375_9ROSA|nr:hypothetical protein L484_017786 [Morus notabilis]
MSGELERLLWCFNYGLKWKTPEIICPEGLHQKPWGRVEFLISELAAFPMGLPQEGDPGPSNEPNIIKKNPRPKRTKNIPGWLEGYEHQPTAMLRL